MSANTGGGDYKGIPQEDGAEVINTKRAATSVESGAIPTALLPVTSYCAASILMTVVNKYCVSGQQFTMNFLLLTIQSTVCVACVLFFKKTGIIKFRDFDSTDAKKWFPISFLLVSVIYTGSKSLQYLSIPVYTIFKNLTIILIAYGEVIWFGGRVTQLTMVSFFLMVLSSVIAAWSDIATGIQGIQSSWSDTFSAVAASASVTAALTKHIGYFWMMVNCLTTAAYVLSMRKRIKVTGFKDWDTMFYNNLLSIPVLVVFSFIVEDWGSESLNQNFPAPTRTVLLFAITFSGAAAVGISYTTAWCVRTTSSTTYSMVGALNKLPIALSGIIFFGDAATFGSISAIGVGFVAGLVYAMAKNNQKKEDSLRERASGVIPLHNMNSKRDP